MSLRILIAEDEDAIRRVWETIFTRLGHSPRGVSDGVAALKALEEEPFDVLVTDLKMPNMSGLELLEIIETNPSFEGLATYVCSGFVDDPAVFHGLRVRGMIRKPFKVSEILKYFREELSGA